MNSPFPYETYAENDTFYGRAREIAQLKNCAVNSNNIVIYSKRRMGKSSLIKEALKGSDALFIYCDVFQATSAEDVATLLLKSLSNSIKGDIKSVVKTLSNLFKRVKPEFTIDPHTGEIAIRPAVKSLSAAEMFEDFFHSLFQLAQKQPVALAIDEFQQIATVKDVRIDAILRGYMQENVRVAYMFLGSKRHMLGELFEYRAPLFEMATPLLLEPLAITDIYHYTSKHLHIEAPLVEYIYELADGETKLMQHIFHILYLAHRRTNITKELIDDALREILDAKSSAYKVIFDSFSQYQKKGFRILGKYERNIFSEEVLKEENIAKGTLLSALRQLYKREIIDKESDRWFIPDRTLELWAKRVAI